MKGIQKDDFLVSDTSQAALNQKSKNYKIIGVITYDLLVTRPDALPTKLKKSITVEPMKVSFINCPRFASSPLENR